ncbi:hypothetical protein DMN91_010213 [Ooceraea biroi]|uniref:Uncharacterized protein n=1 Tax=Ooceraea biroi TaxID=2015173 RepID=A0A3L8DCU8_OOCBI|nr:hypothetical protein DMN91_010213 [Ooceraea biroi]
MRADDCRGSIRAGQVALTQGPEIAAGEPSQSVPRLTRVRISCSALAVPSLAVSAETPESNPRARENPRSPRTSLGAVSRSIGDLPVARTDRAPLLEDRKLKSIDIRISFPFARSPARPRAPAEDDADNVRAAHLERPIRGAMAQK